MSTTQYAQPWLSKEQVGQLNDKHGWFHYGDAQSVSEAFAQDAIEMHERMRAAAPLLLSALQRLLETPGAPTLDDWANARAAVEAAGAA